MSLDNLEPTAIDTAMTDFIAETQKEFQDSFLAEEALEAPAPQDQGTVTAEPVLTPEAPKEGPTDRGLERLIAREMELRERENALSREKAEVEAYRARFKELEARALPEDYINQIKLSPSEGLRRLGLDPDEIVRNALAEKLGDKAPPEMRELLEKTRLRREMEALKAQVQEGERRQAAQTYFNQVANGARDFLGKSEEISKDAPTVAHVAKNNPDRAYQEIMEEIVRDAQVRATREPNGDVMSYAEAAKRVEARWSAMKSLLVPVTPESNPGAASMTQVADTKQNVAKETPKSPPSTIKPPERPLAPWLQTSKSEEDAIRAAIDEWRRAESVKR
jgi:hypothetical protein